MKSNVTKSSGSYCTNYNDDWTSSNHREGVSSWNSIKYQDRFLYKRKHESSLPKYNEKKI